ncbi:MAG: AbrB/MazE/SpoVT family DNA-binding domain-containing protein [Eubacteriales bacterium]|nr:AbrB/MazE/SpoVT family DNA-binding domain-containing protein [Eubacteriales bacterium]MDD4476522.1 AbrB/MazE/SpoVT family DNA-binding domain-containing protein [Eubacteriales bacterium]
MKLLGIVRKVDELGRIVVPMELRRSLNINEKDPVEIFAEGDKIIIRKFSPACIFCGSTENVSSFKDKLVCEECIASIKSTNTSF